MRTVFVIMLSILLIVPSVCADNNDKRSEKQNAYKRFFAQVYDTLKDTPGHIFSPELVLKSKSGRKFRIGFSHEERRFTVDYNFNVPGGLQIKVRQREREQRVTIIDENVDGKVDDSFYGWSRSPIPKNVSEKETRRNSFKLPWPESWRNCMGMNWANDVPLRPPESFSRVKTILAGSCYSSLPIFRVSTTDYCALLLPGIMQPYSFNLIGMSTTSSIPDAEAAIQQFTHRLLAEQGTDELDLDKEVRDQLERDLQERVKNRINAAILAAMPTEKHADFEKVLDSGSEEDVQQFCSQAIPDLDQMVARELISFRETYLGIV